MYKNAFLNRHNFISPESVFFVMNEGRKMVIAKRKKDLKIMKKNVKSINSMVLDVNNLTYSFIKNPSVTYSQVEKALTQLEYINAKQENILATYEKTGFLTFLEETKYICETSKKLAELIAYYNNTLTNL